LYKEHCKDSLTKKEVHVFLNCNLDFQVENALVFSIAKAQKNNEGQANKIAQSKLADKPFLTVPFWRNVIRFFADNPPENIDLINDLTDYLQHKYTLNNDFSLAGQHLQTIIRKMHDWHYELRRAKVMGDSRWDGSDIPDQAFYTKDQNGDDIIWQITQIKTSKRLAQEGSTMRHCVLSYKNRCISGDCSIWSLSKTEKFSMEQPKITIELRRDGMISQVRGLANRAARPEERNILNMWVRKNNLSF